MSATYLTWIGAKHYPTFEDFASESDVLGVSKRMPTVGAALALKDATVFLAHDEGERVDCPDCYNEKLETCTGGWALVDGKKITYRKFLSQKKRGKIGEDAKIETLRCETCSGLGKLPNGQIFGFFLASGVEYILDPQDGKHVREKMEREGVKTITLKQTASEPKRGCGYRQPGGVYLTTSPASEEDSAKVNEIVSELSKQGIIDPDHVNVRGRLARFMVPIPIPGIKKRFRGIKQWEPTREVQAETTMTELAAG